MIEILKNLPVPQKYALEKNGRRASKYPFEEMELGEFIQKQTVYLLEAAVVDKILVAFLGLVVHQLMVVMMVS